MADRDKFGNYVNEKGVVIKVNTDKNGGDHISFYDGDVDAEHEGVHINIDYENETWNSTSHNADKSETTRSSGGCYLTSACIKHFKNAFDDSGYELTVLRWFRDNFVTKEDVRHYYKVAPLIVTEINKEEKRDLIYDYIYDNIVDYCVTEIEKGNYINAYNRYKQSILSLEEHYIRPTLNKKLIRTLKNI